MIDDATIQRIFDTATIEEVVGDYVSLRKQGANFIGLCPFHNDRRPSFYVSPSKNICKCFACGEGGSPVSFIMKIEKISFPDALRVLAKKYGIPIEEKEESQEEKEKRNERESMFLAQSFAADYFAKQLSRSEEGLHVAIPYLQQRGITTPFIEKFGLGYASSQRDGLTKAAQEAGYNLKYFAETGLCYPPEDGRGGGDRFRERIIFPIHTVSGKIVGFGGRIMKKSDRLAKYINSPESPIYSKSNELYGLYLGKKAITQADKCFLVEGYMDVIAMHQGGIENVVASSGTALTLPQIMKIRRFTRNVTVFYDGDLAGVKATLRGIDLLLEAGMHVRALPLPEDEDPDSFVRGHTIQELEDYIQTHEEDFITFKTALYKKDMVKSPIEKANLVNDLLKSVASIPDPIERSLTVQSVAQDLSMNEAIIAKEVKVLRNNHSFQRTKFLPVQSENNAEGIRDEQQELEQTTPPLPHPSKNELALLRLIVRYGEQIFPITYEDGSEERYSLAQFVENALHEQEIEDYGELFKKILSECCQNIEKNPHFSPSQYFANHRNPQISSLTINLLADKYLLSNVSKRALGLSDEATNPPIEELIKETELLINGMIGEYVQRQIDHYHKELKKTQSNPLEEERMMQILAKLSELNEIKAQLATIMGMRTIIP